MSEKVGILSAAESNPLFIFFIKPQNRLSCFVCMEKICCCFSKFCPFLSVFVFFLEISLIPLSFQHSIQTFPGLSSTRVEASFFSLRFFCVLQRPFLIFSHNLQSFRSKRIKMSPSTIFCDLIFE